MLAKREQKTKELKGTAGKMKTFTGQSTHWPVPTLWSKENMLMLFSSAGNGASCKLVAMNRAEWIEGNCWESKGFVHSRFSGQVALNGGKWHEIDYESNWIKWNVAKWKEKRMNKVPNGRCLWPGQSIRWMTRLLIILWWWWYGCDADDASMNSTVLNVLCLAWNSLWSDWQSVKLIFFTVYRGLNGTNCRNS